VRATNSQHLLLAFFFNFFLIGRGQGEVMIVALRPIAVAQEIFVSYLDTADQGGERYIYAYI
jgi:hypothetical protein